MVLSFRVRSFFVSLPIPHITMFALLVHMAFGCCWHHGHVCLPTGGGALAGGTGFCQRGEHAQCDTQQTHGHEHRGNETSYPSHHDSHEHQCDGSDCVFVRSDGSSAERSDVGFDGGLFDSDLVSIAASSSLIQPPERTVLCDMGARESLRAHLLFSVLLI